MESPGKEGRHSPGGKPQLWLSGARPVLAWAVPAFLGLYIKFFEMQPGRGFKIASRYFGRIERMNETALTFLEKLSFFRMDLLIGCVLIPLGLVVLSRCLPARWRAPCIVGLSWITSVALLVQARALQQVGRFLSLATAVTAFRYGWQEPGANRMYLSIGSLLGLLGGIVFTGWVLWWQARRSGQRAVRAASERRWRIAGAAALSGLLLISLLAWLPRLPATPYQQSALGQALASYGDESDADTREFSGQPLSELARRYRQMTGAPVPRQDQGYWGKARGYNVVFFILETAPASFLPADQPLDDLPHLRRLRANSFVGVRHYSTYPYTNRALFSLFSSWYPSGTMKDFAQQHPNTAFPGIIRALSAQGYETAYYAPYHWRIENYEQMLFELGFQQQKYPEDAAFPHPREEGRSSWKAARIMRDREALSLLKQDLERWLADGRRFAVAFAPQAGHLPWPDADDGDSEQDFLRRGRAMLAVQDAWLGDLLELLERHQQLDHTLIVVVGDHGIRTRQEDPRFSGGTVDEYSFHVPFLLYAPKVLARTEIIPWMTSHIDVAPTLLDLLGIERAREIEQGASIWNRDLADRTTYFFAHHLLGADGYHSPGQCFMRNYMSDSTYTSDQLHFETRNVLPQSSLTHLEVCRAISRMVGLQQVWAAQYARIHPLRTERAERSVAGR